jgi:hypothetical protein
MQLLVKYNKWLHSAEGLFEDSRKTIPVCVKSLGNGCYIQLLALFNTGLDCKKNSCFPSFGLKPKGLNVRMVNMPCD